MKYIYNIYNRFKCLAVCAFVLALGFGSSLLSQSTAAWKKGDWWLVEQKQQAVWMNVKNPPWIKAGKLKFTIKDVIKTRDGSKYMVEVVDTRRPAQMKKKWKMHLVYSGNFELTGGSYELGKTRLTVKKALRYIPLKTGGLNMSTLKSDEIKREPTRESTKTQRFMDKRIKKERLFHRIDMKIPKTYKRLNVKAAKEYQLWLPGEPWWRYYERSYGLPVKAELVDCSKWK